MISTNLLITFIIIAITIIIAIRIKKNNNLSIISILLAGLFLCIFTLIYPLSEDGGKLQRIVFSILYSIQCIYVGQDFELVQSSILVEKYSWLYVVTLYTTFLLAPILTTGFVLSLIENFVHGIKCQLAILNPFKKEIHIFSNINEESITLAENVRKKNNVIIFCNEKEEDIKESLKDKIRKMNAISVASSEKNIKIGNKRAHFYEISQNEIENMDNALILTNK